MTSLTRLSYLPALAGHATCHPRLSLRSTGTVVMLQLLEWLQKG